MGPTWRGLTSPTVCCSLGPRGCVTNGYMSSADSHHLAGHHAEAQPPGLHRRSQSSQCLTAPFPRGHTRATSTLTGFNTVAQEGKQTDYWNLWQMVAALKRPNCSDGGSLHWFLWAYKQSVMHFFWITLWAHQRAAGLQYLLPCLRRLVSLILWFGVSDVLQRTTPPPQVYVLKLFKSLNM